MRDHPRSRGVYRDRVSHYLLLVGSSPLARGLREAPLGREEGGGIIPARAGFTTRTSSKAWGPRDHPRSRGVYIVMFPDFGYGLGSSPLARGLRQHGGEGPGEGGIIPARAGFTTWTAWRRI